MMPDLESIEERLRAVENAVVEIGAVHKMMKVVVAILCCSLGVDVTGVL